MSYHLKWEDEGVVNTITDIHSMLEDNEAVIEIFKDPRREIIKYIIWDLTQISGTTMKNVQAEFHARIVETHVSDLGSIKVVFVTDDGEMRDLCIKYIHNALANGSKWKFNVTEKVAEAREWIKL